MMNSRFKLLSKNLGILTISNFASKILVFLLVPLYTSVLSTEEYGTYDLAVSVVLLLFPLFTLNIVDACMRFLMEKNAKREKIAIIGIRQISISIIMFGVFMVCISKASVWKTIAGLETYVFMYYLTYALNEFFIQFAKGINRITDMAVAGVISTISMISTNILFLVCLGWGLQGFFLANIVSQGVSVIYFVIRIRFWNYISTWKVDYVLNKEMLCYSFPLIATALCWWINSTSDKYIISLMLGVSANGLLAVSYKIPSIINTIQGIFIQAWQISAIKEYGNGDTSGFYGNTFSIVNVLMCAACAWLILLAKPIASILYAKDFYAAWQYVPFLLIASVLNCASGLIGPILAAKKNSKAMMWSALIGAGANIILNIVFVYFMGTQGACIATAICSFIIYYVRKEAVREDIKIEQYSIVLITWFLLCIQAIIEIIISNYIMELGLMTIMLIINWKGVSGLLKMVKKC